MVKYRRLRKTTIEVQPHTNVDIQCEHQSLSREHVEQNNDHLPIQTDSNAHSQPATDSLIHGSPTNTNECSSPPKKRGPTLLSDIFSQPLTERVIVEFNKRGQAIGREGRVLASFLGIVARDPVMSPLNIEDWRAFPRHEKKELLKFVKGKFSIPSHGQQWVMKSLGRKWKDYKCELRNEFLEKYRTVDALRNNKPQRIPRDQWNGLIQIWTTDKSKKRSAINKINRAKQIMAHTAGSKSFARLMAEKAKDGVEPSRAQIFIETHKDRKDGRPIDQESAKRVEMMMEKLTQTPDTIEQPPGSVAWEGDVYSQVMGPERNGRMRGVGLGPTVTSLWNPSSSEQGETSTFNVASDEAVQKLKDDMKLMEQRHADELNSMKSELTFFRACMSKMFPSEFGTSGSNGTTNGTSRLNETLNGEVPDAFSPLDRE